MRNNSVKILFAASEASPFAKVGGLADVVGSLPIALVKNYGVDARIIIPLYNTVRECGYKLKRISKKFTLQLGEQRAGVSLFEIKGYKIPVYLVDCPKYLRREGIYGYDPGAGFEDNLERYAMFCKTVVKLFALTGWRPDVVHCNDWQTSLIPAYLKAEREKAGSPLSRTGSLLTVHNLAYQGEFPQEKLEAPGIDGDLFPWESIEFHGKLNLLKIGIISADRLNTVSSSYRDETLAGGVTGAGLEDGLRARGNHYTGILNGIDYDDWPPLNGKWLMAEYDGDLDSYKAASRNALFALCGFNPSMRESPVMGLISRLAHQKGIDIFIDALDGLIASGFHIVILGSGDETLQARLTEYREKYPGRIHTDFTFNQPLAHQVYAGADMFLMPSRYEPCGLTQMIAMRNGTVPLVNSVGGLKDSVEEFNPDTGAGDGFRLKELSPGGLLEVSERAMRVFRDKSNWRRLMANAAAKDFGWTQSAQRYYELYREIIEETGGAL